ncbi:DNA glycosylase [Flammula alnicola]|nr:DNA glycosylase [Flammula alnicola]
MKSKSSTSRKTKAAATRKKAKVLKIDASSRSSNPQGIYADLPRHSKSAHTISSPGPVRIALLDWYKTVHDTRKMPWRKAYNPTLGPEERAQRAYEVWISEIMLQQTQVATVIPYYNRWMEKFPTIRDLAAATIDEVNAQWKGLGYYTRARRLLDGAQKAIKEYGGKLPDNAKDMEANIPGIGRYSAGAICSIAYGEQVPVLDGNVHRLLSRFLALYAPPKAKPTLDILWSGARTMVEIDGLQSPQYPGDINQALIELGSTVCKVREPNCETCPLQTWCSAYQRSTAPADKSNAVIDIEEACQVCEPLTDFEGVMSYPMKVDRKKAREELDIVHVVEWYPKSNSEDRRFLMVRRPESGLLAGLYDFPTSVDVPKSTTPQAQETLPAEVLAKIIHGSSHLSPTLVTENAAGNDPPQTERPTISSIRSVGEVVHVFSHIRKTYRVQWVILEGGDNPPATREDPFQEGRQTRKSGKEKRPVKGVKVMNQSDGPKGAIWVPLNEVMETNMGSGVVKVWNMTKKLWEEEAECK